MKKSIRNLILGATCTAMLFAATGCNPPTGEELELIHSDTEDRPVALAIGALDQNFNPFTYTSANDGEVIGMTQISMLTADANGYIVCGDDQATMVRDYSVTSYSSTDDSQVSTGSETPDHTTYKFVIKNGVKDSTGHDMSILDVLFNLYVYLDPVYTGSSTIYSTKIQGLAAYRSQDPNAADDKDITAEYRPNAQARFNAILDYDSTDGTTGIDEVKEDIQLVYKYFIDGLNSDWNNVVGTLNSYPEYRFTEDWQLYMLNEGMIGYQYRYVNNIKTKYTDADEKYYTTLDPKQSGALNGDAEFDTSAGIRAEMEEALNGLTGTERAQKMQETAVNQVANSYFIEKGNASDRYIDGYGKGKLTEILTQWTVGGDVMNALIRDEMSKNAPTTPDGSLAVKSISGITTDKTSSKLDGGVMGVDLGGEEHDVLIIKIKGVDPAAIYNFAFTVAPMHYYSGTFGGKDYVAEAQANWRNPDASNRFGVCFQNSDFMTNVIGSKNVPVGAGAYKMKVGESQFYDGSMVRYERNENFTTLGSGVENAKIKYLNYVYTTDDQIVNSLKKGTIDYGQPNCTPTNVQQVTGEKHLNMRNYAANGFGYVGINPTYVPDRGVRIAIMLAMNPQTYIIKNYYTPDYSSPIYRPTSTTNFLNDYDETGSLTTPYKFRENDPYNRAIKDTVLEWTDNATKLTQLVQNSGWTKGSDGKFTKDGKMLTLTFTIAGETTDHPAWQMFTKAAEQLNAIGFDITVKKDSQALIKLAAGKLEVWAAAWSTGIDPDMYQIYHKDSTASSTKNWGYDAILNNAEKFSVENSMLTRLSASIDDARSTTVEKYRTESYVSALNDVMEMAVEMPTYQRHELGVYNRQIIKADSLNANPSSNAGLLFKIWELDYN
ncbi:MAG: hypothetical protein K2K38_06090 [Clostridia bacterium]|nr:hypothetical protein [Clostridia bacterium]